MRRRRTGKIDDSEDYDRSKKFLIELVNSLEFFRVFSAPRSPYSTFHGELHDHPIIYPRDQKKNSIPGSSPVNHLLHEITSPNKRILNNSRPKYLIFRRAFMKHQLIFKLSRNPCQRFTLNQKNTFSDAVRAFSYF